MQVSPCHPRSSIFATATAMPVLIISASKPGGRAGSEKSTVSGFWPTNNIRVIFFSPSERPHGLLRNYRRSDDPSDPGRNLAMGEVGRARLVARERYSFSMGPMRVGKHSWVEETRITFRMPLQ